jgi:hypothetical protein
MKVSDLQFAVPPVITGGIEFFKQFMADPAETAGGIASAVGEELKEYPARQLRTALSGGETFNPKTGEIERFDPFAVPATVAAGTAVSIARTADKFGGGPVLGIMAGRMAKDGPTKFSQARASRSAGGSKQEVFDETQSYFDDDILGQDTDAFRFEIPTANSNLNEKLVFDGRMEGFRSVRRDDDYGAAPINDAPFARLEDILDFPELYEQYPEIKDLRVARINEFGGAFYDSARNYIAVADQLNNEQFQSALLHEIQHWVQHKEGFPTGGSSQNIQNQLAYRMDVQDPKLLKGPARDLYQSLYGEAEARTVQRRFLDPEEAKLTPILTRQKEAPDGDISMSEIDAVDRGEEALIDALEYGDISYSDIYPETFSGGSGKPLKRDSVGFQPSEKIARDPDTIYYKGKPIDEMSPKSTGLLGGDKPQRFYHGTNAAYKEFDSDAPYTFVADKPSTAEYYAGDVPDGTPNIRPVYLKDVNFFDVDNPEHMQQLLDSDWYAQYGKSLDDVFYDYSEDMNFLDLVEAGDYGTIEDSGLVDWIRSQGFDGFTTYEQDGKNYGVFNVENIVPGVAKKKDGGIITLADVARNTGRGPMGVASLSSTARNMNRPMVS